MYKQLNMARKANLAQTLAPIVRSLAGKINRTNPTVTGRRRGGARASKASRRRSGTKRRALPAAYAAHVRPRFRVLSRTDNSVTISGCDLIYPIPYALTSSSDTIFSVFPANPAYWMGTRIAQFAKAYQNYRPLRFHVSYIPQVAVTQQGTVFMGTLWNEAAPSTNIQQSLFTSNGGCLTQCYVPCDTEVRLGSNLQQNLFTLTHDLNPDTCPFLFLAGVRGSDVVPGYFYVTYTYEFKNPIGDAWVFNTSEPVKVAALTQLTRFTNMTVVLLDQDGLYGPGTQFNYEADGGIYYHDSLIELDDDTRVIVYANSQNQINPNAVTKTIINAIYDVPGRYEFYKLTKVTSNTTISLTHDRAYLIIYVNADSYRVGYAVVASDGTHGITATESQPVYWGELPAGFGTTPDLMSGRNSIVTLSDPGSDNFFTYSAYRKSFFYFDFE